MIHIKGLNNYVKRKLSSPSPSPSPSPKCGPRADTKIPWASEIKDMR